MRKTAAEEGVTRSVLPRAPLMMNSLISCLDLACRGYLCAPLVDCDPETDPECGSAGKKLLMPDAKPSGFVENASPEFGMGAGVRFSLKEAVDEDISRN